MPQKRPIILVHGYSDKGESFASWRHALDSRGFATEVCSYETLVNEITVKDIAEGFERALRMQTGLKGDEPFDVIVHSTGMLVVRAWLTTYDKRRDRIKHLIGLAPATFGSPLAHKGRSWLGSIFKGRKELGPDFLEAGDLVLDALELGSRFTWDLAHLDLIGSKPVYGKSAGSPYVFIFCGNRPYTGLAGLVNQPGTDGTVRWAGCPFNTRKIILDLTRDPARPTSEQRTSVAPWSNVGIPLTLVDGLNHSTILRDPTDEVIDLVVTALRVGSGPDFDTWQKQAGTRSLATRKAVDEWQQFIVHAIDERGDPISDFNLQLLTEDGKKLRAFDLDVHNYGADQSFRCFHVNLSKLQPRKLKRLQVRIIASSGTRFVSYHGIGSEKIPVAVTSSPRDGKWDAQMDISAAIDDEQLFFPFTTTLLELQLNREPVPLRGYNDVTWFLPRRSNDGIQ